MKKFIFKTSKETFKNFLEKYSKDGIIEIGFLDNKKLPSYLFMKQIVNDANKIRKKYDMQLLRTKIYD